MLNGDIIFKLKLSDLVFQLINDQLTHMAQEFRIDILANNQLLSREPRRLWNRII